jgi:hypothetical protein
VVVSGALFLVLGMDHPYGGKLRMSQAPLRNAVNRIGRP